VSDLVLKSVVQGVGVVTLNRPHVLNAWNQQMLEQLIDAFEVMDSELAVGAIVLTGAGNRALGAGQDFAESKDFDADRRGVPRGSLKGSLQHLGQRMGWRLPV
jgi:enoyl-CoA hydratase/carnithine racemase